MSKKNNLAKRKRQHEFELRSTFSPSIFPPIQTYSSIFSCSDFIVVIISFRRETREGKER
jgi:hypothetical protein